MNTTGYRSDGVGLAVAVVNGTFDPEVDETEAFEAALRQFGVMINRKLTGRERAGMRQWAQHLHQVFAARQPADAAALLNQLLDVVSAHPFITDHDGRGLHLHYAPPEASPLHRVQASTALGLAALICDYGMTRLGVCRAAGCECVYVDVSRNAQRRFCSEACANRTNVAAFRARARDAATATVAG